VKKPKPKITSFGLPGGPLPGSPSGNHSEKVKRLLAGRELAVGGYTEIEIVHDDWCAIFAGQDCDCNPDVSIRGTGKFQ
jgi:hypothetical protein